MLPHIGRAARTYMTSFSPGVAGITASTRRHQLPVNQRRERRAITVMWITEGGTVKRSVVVVIFP
jgi:hypothetical protein